MATVRRLQAVIFDVAGTLIALRESVGTTYARFATRYGVYGPAGRLDEAFARVLAAAPPNVHPGVTLREAAELERRWWWERVRETFRAADGSALIEGFDAFFAEVYLHYAGAAAWQVLPGAETALDVLAERDYALAVLSSFDQRLRPLLRELGLHHRFDAITLPADAGAAKPDRAIFDVCLKRLGLGSFQCVYVGDHALLDVKASRAVGMRAIAVNTLPDLAALPDAVARLESTEETA